MGCHDFHSPIQVQLMHLEKESRYLVTATQESWAASKEVKDDEYSLVSRLRLVS